MNAQTMYACYRRPDPHTGQLHRRKPKPGEPESPIGLIEYTRNPALFFHAEKYRGINEEVRLAIMAADSLSAAESILEANQLDDLQRARWSQVRDRVLLCAAWFASTQHTGRALGVSPAFYDGLDAQAAYRQVIERLKSPTRLVIAGSREMTAREAGYALIDWFVRNPDLTATGHGVAGVVDEVVSGNANGSDSIGEEWAMHNYIPVVHFPAAWGLGNHAGYLRNEDMGRVGTHLLAFHIAHSKGTANMIDIFVKAKKPSWKFTDSDVAKMKQMVAAQSVAIPDPVSTAFSPEI